ncbi:hypothetical protein G5I_12788 [Acromyrmex echinatior]|uniref:Uncharacterized protein n=1 Tax=Acromyrmex echinatior TaxID=103372 RepID=F4X394_ACREC|nr:hypothetical protein G5I_12788 [Acromyrmex echinatior]
MLSSDEVLQQYSRNVPADARDSTRDFTGRDRGQIARYRSRWINAPVKLRGFRYAGVSPGAVAAAYKQHQPVFAFTRNSVSLTSVAKRRTTKRCGAAARDRQRSAISTISRRSKRWRLNRSSRRTVSFCQQRARETETPPWSKDFLPARLSPRDSRNAANARGRAAHSENGLDFYHVTERRRIPDMAKADDNRLHPWDVFMQL